jgi:hypothetical protein
MSAGDATLATVWTLTGVEKAVRASWAADT